MVCITDSCNTFLPLEQPNQPRTHSEKSSQSLQSSCVPDHGTRSLYRVCHWRDTVHASCSHDTDLTLLCQSEPLLPMSVSLSVTPGVVTDRPVTPNDFLMSSACRGSASQVMPSAVHSTILRMLCTKSWYPGGPRIPRFVTNQNSCSFTKNHLTLTM